MKALIDADIFCYEFGNLTDLETGGLLPWEITRHLLDEKIQYILQAVEADDFEMYLTDSASNFRNRIASILPYKGHRPSDKPPHWDKIRQHLIDNYDAEVQYGMEADDACGIAQCAAIELDRKISHIQIETVICSRDKDLDMIPGWHYRWQCGKQEERKYFVDEKVGIRFFYKQLLTGDATDNILGLYGVGEKSSLVKKLSDLESEFEMYEHVYKQYSDRFGNYAWQFMLENASLLWIARGIDSPEPMYEIYNRFISLQPQEIKHEDSEINGDETSVQDEGS